jgi:hypothetical protein
LPIYLTPGSTCPHGVKIHDGDVCVVKHCASNHTQQEIDRSEAPRPENPEDKAARRIGEYRKAMEGLDPAKHPRLIAGLRDEIAKQQEIISEYSGQPTVYRPNPKLKGGKS